MIGAKEEAKDQRQDEGFFCFGGVCVWGGGREKIDR